MTSINMTNPLPLTSTSVPGEPEAGSTLMEAATATEAEISCQAKKRITTAAPTCRRRWSCLAMPIAHSRFGYCQPIAFSGTR